MLFRSAEKVCALSVIPKALESIADQNDVNKSSRGDSDGRLVIICPLGIRNGLVAVSYEKPYRVRDGG